MRCAQRRAIRGDLAIATTRGAHQQGGNWTATRAKLTAGGGELLPHLVDIAVTKMVGNSFLIVGTEVNMKPGPGATFQCQQTWWCRLVFDLTSRNLFGALDPSYDDDEDDAPAPA